MSINTIGIGAGLHRAPPAPPRMRVRTRRFVEEQQDRPQTAH